jgi:hypothetical protein
MSESHVKPRDLTSRWFRKTMQDWHPRRPEDGNYALGSSMKSPYPSNSAEGTPPVPTPTETGTAVITEARKPTISGTGRIMMRRSYRDLMSKLNAIFSIGSLVLIDSLHQFKIFTFHY